MPETPESPPAVALRLDGEMFRLLKSLAITAHMSPAEYVSRWVIAEYDRWNPGKRDFAQLPQERRRERLMKALGWTSWPDLDEEGRRELDAAMDAADEQARRFYGEVS